MERFHCLIFTSFILCVWRDQPTHFFTLTPITTHGHKMSWRTTSCVHFCYWLFHIGVSVSFQIQTKMFLNEFIVMDITFKSLFILSQHLKPIIIVFFHSRSMKYKKLVQFEKQTCKIARYLNMSHNSWFKCSKITWMRLQFNT